ncbi:unnamed protein product [Nippostrongylus brasiliensis]|uniref:Endo/exonuclease/phosphatase domain-containing protein n=1 Tax=Nippostrongylus brasiliensis TaxID=27835 RepID=A0A0N4YCY5_NIPBR|nr:unnamed protein product [Nippostrongylus brasiliensis]
MPSGFTVVTSLLLLTVSMGVSGVLRVMTFNIWLSGASVHNGLHKIAKHIRLVNPDIVALQEVEDVYVIGNLTEMLGEPWIGIHHQNRSLPDTGILTRHEYLSYGPYAAYNKMVTSIDQILAGEDPKSGESRKQNAEELRNNPKMTAWRRKSDIVPIIVAGDFNCPSHLDWTEAARKKHGGWQVTWPATKIMEEMGFIDSFRELHPDIEAEPGYTWSTCNKFNSQWDYTIPEPQDRIDFIFYQGKIEPIRSYTYAGSEPLKPIPYHRDNDYPSDHFALVTEFNVAKHIDAVAPDLVALQTNREVSSKLMREKINTFITGRLSVLKEILENQKMKRWLKASKFVSLIVAGDFGSPSHLDWNEENKELHRGLTVEWPVSKVMDDANFIDSYRNLHTDAKVSPGVTWSTIVKTNLMNPALSEPQDRIDFIFYQGRIIPKKSFTYAGSMVLESEPNHRDNDYPSQRYAVVTEFAEEAWFTFFAQYSIILPLLQPSAKKKNRKEFIDYYMESQTMEKSSFGTVYKQKRSVGRKY